MLKLLLGHWQTHKKKPLLLPREVDVFQDEHDVERANRLNPLYEDSDDQNNSIVSNSSSEQQPSNNTVLIDDSKKEGSSDTPVQVNSSNFIDTDEKSVTNPESTDTSSLGESQSEQPSELQRNVIDEEALAAVQDVDKVLQLASTKTENNSIDNTDHTHPVSRASIENANVDNRESTNNNGELLSLIDHIDDGQILKAESENTSIKTQNQISESIKHSQPDQSAEFKTVHSQEPENKLDNRVELAESKINGDRKSDLDNQDILSVQDRSSKSTHQPNKEKKYIKRSEEISKKSGIVSQTKRGSVVSSKVKKTLDGDSKIAQNTEKVFPKESEDQKNSEEMGNPQENTLKLDSSSSSDSSGTSETKALTETTSGNGVTLKKALKVRAKAIEELIKKFQSPGESDKFQTPSKIEEVEIKKKPNIYSSVSTRVESTADRNKIKVPIASASVPPPVLNFPPPPPPPGPSKIIKGLEKKKDIIPITESQSKKADFKKSIVTPVRPNKEEKIDQVPTKEEYSNVKNNKDQSELSKKLNPIAGTSRSFETQSTYLHPTTNSAKGLFKTNETKISQSTIGADNISKSDTTKGLFKTNETKISQSTIGADNISKSDTTELFDKTHIFLQKANESKSYSSKDISIGNTADVNKGANTTNNVIKSPSKTTIAKVPSSSSRESKKLDTNTSTSGQVKSVPKINDVKQTSAKTSKFTKTDESPKIKSRPTQEKNPSKKTKSQITSEEIAKGESPIPKSQSEDSGITRGDQASSDSQTSDEKLLKIEDNPREEELPTMKPKSEVNEEVKEKSNPQSKQKHGKERKRFSKYSHGRPCRQCKHAKIDSSNPASGLTKGQCDDYYNKVIRDGPKLHRHLRRPDSWASDMSWDEFVEKEYLSRLHKHEHIPYYKPRHDTIRSSYRLNHEKGHRVYRDPFPYRELFVDELLARQDILNHHRLHRHQSDDSSSVRLGPAYRPSPSICSCEECWLHLAQRNFGRSSVRSKASLWEDDFCTCGMAPHFVERGRKVKFAEHHPHKEPASKDTTLSHRDSLSEGNLESQLKNPSEGSSESDCTPSHDQSATTSSKADDDDGKSVDSSGAKKDKSSEKPVNGSKNPSLLGEDQYRPYPWEIEEWDRLVRHRLLKKRRRRARCMGIMALAIVIFVGLVVAVVMVYLRRKML